MTGAFTLLLCGSLSHPKLLRSVFIISATVAILIASSTAQVLEQYNEAVAELRGWADAERTLNRLVEQARSRSQQDEIRRAWNEFKEGNALLQRDKIEEARARFLKAVNIHPLAPAYNNLGVTWMRSNDFAKARKAFEHALKVDRNDARAAMNMARLVYLDQDWPRAEDLLKRTLNVYPDNVLALAMMTMTEFRLEKYDETVTFARRTHAVSPDQQPVVHFLAARALMIQRKPDGAVAEYQLYLQEAPQSELAPSAQKELQQIQAH